MKTKHTEGKLTVSKTAHHRLESESGMVIADAWSDPGMSIEQSLANAERLALAWNLHDEFREASMEVLESASPSEKEHPRMFAAFRRLNEIYAKATKVE